jgi:thiol:disulfide interchange protein DsbD
MKKIYCISLMLILSAAVVCAQESPVEWTAKGPDKAQRAGEKVSVELSAKIDSGWHLYSITQPPGGPTTTVISVPPKQVLEAAGTITGPVPQTAYDPNFEMDTEFYEELASFKVPLVVDSKAKPGPANVVIDVLFQVCNDTTCMPPTTVHVPLKVTIASGAPAPAKDRVKSSGASTATEQNPKAVSIVSLHSRTEVRATSSVPPAASSEPKQPPSTPFPHEDAQSLASFL